LSNNKGAEQARRWPSLRPDEKKNKQDLLLPPDWPSIMLRFFRFATPKTCTPPVVCLKEAGSEAGWLQKIERAERAHE